MIEIFMYLDNVDNVTFACKRFSQLVKVKKADYNLLLKKFRIPNYLKKGISQVLL